MRHINAAGFRTPIRLLSWFGHFALAGSALLAFVQRAVGQPRVTIQEYNLPILSLSFSPDSALFAASSYTKPGKGLTVWNVATGKKVFGSGAHNHAVNCVAFSPDAKSLATTGGSKEPVVLYDTSTWKIGRTLKGTEFLGTRHLTFARDGTFLVVLSSDGVVSFWDPVTGKQLKAELAIAATRPGSVVDSKAQIALSPNGKTLAVAAGKDAVLWDLTAGKERATLKSHVSNLVCLAISPDGKTLVTTEEGGPMIDNTVAPHVCVWDLEMTKLKYRLDRLKKIHIKGIAFAPDSKTMATAGEGHTQLWDVATGRHVLELPGGAKRAVSVAWSPDGFTIAEGALNGDIRLFDVPKDLVPAK
jgi:WD40 repeat protein